MITAIRDGRKVYHWPASIRQLIAARYEAIKSDEGEFDPRSGSPMTPERIKYRELAQEAKNGSAYWQLCACGSLCRAIPRVKNEDEYYENEERPGIQVIERMEEPKDKVLLTLGIRFHEAIRCEDYGLAILTMEEIEERAIKVLQKLGKRPKSYETPKKRAVKAKSKA